MPRSEIDKLPRAFIKPEEDEKRPIGYQTSSRKADPDCVETDPEPTGIDSRSEEEEVHEETDNEKLELQKRLNEAIKMGLDYAEPEYFEGALKDIVSSRIISLDDKTKALKILKDAVDDCLSSRIFSNSPIMQIENVTDDERIEMLYTRRNKLREIRQRVDHELRERSLVLDKITLVEQKE